MIVKWEDRIEEPSGTFATMIPMTNTIFTIQLRPTMNPMIKNIIPIVIATVDTILINRAISILNGVS